MTTPDRNYYIAFFGWNARYYLDVLDDLQRGKKFQFNIGAFFFNFLWMLYRKMYLYAFYLLLIHIGLSIIVAIVGFGEDVPPETNDAISWIISVAVAFVLGLTGNYLYVHHATLVIKKTASRENDESLLIKKLKRKGGTSWIAMFLCLLLISALAYFQNQQASN
jgi:hypothetical protein